MVVRAAKVSPAGNDSSPPVTAGPNHVGINNSAHMVPLSSRASLQASLHRDGSPCSFNPLEQQHSLHDAPSPVAASAPIHPAWSRGLGRPQGQTAPAVPGSSITSSLPVPDLSL